MTSYLLVRKPSSMQVSKIDQQMEVATRVGLEEVADATGAGAATVASSPD